MYANSEHNLNISQTAADRDLECDVKHRKSSSIGLPYSDQASTDLHNSASFAHSSIKQFRDPSPKNRPLGTPFRQQKLSAWRPIISGNIVIFWSFMIGTVFVSVGWYLLNTSNQIAELTVDYTHCNSTQHPSSSCAHLILENITSRCTCQLAFQLDQPMHRPVFLYYALSNYYQNHRRYGRSRDDNQLLGYTSSPGALRANCWPFHRRFDNATGRWMTVAPCGAIANSLFNDTFQLFHVYNASEPANKLEIALLRTGITWPTDKMYKFRNPPDARLFDTYTHPQYWRNYVQTLGNAPDSYGFQYEPLIVWMRVSALPKFRKIYGRILHQPETLFQHHLPAGQYVVHIEYNYPVSLFKGTKSIVLSNTNWFGGKNVFLAYAYMATGTFCLILTLVLVFLSCKCASSTSELIEITETTPYLWQGDR